MDNFSIKTFLLKISARCNINCTYCYEYNLEDQSWKGKPSKMSKSVLNSSLQRIKNHILKYSLTNITIIFHGGEPLLAGIDFFKYVLSEISNIIPSTCEVKYGTQTNGILLTKEYLDFFAENNISVGISIDGFKEINDKYRLDHKNNSTYQKTLDSINLISNPEYSNIRGGLLCVIQPNSNPIELYKWFLNFGSIGVDFLFPHYNYDRLPDSLFDVNNGYGYGLWLSKIFDFWWDNDINTSKIRIFEDIIHLLIGGKTSVESLGISPVDLIVIQSDGEYEAVDSLKSTYDGAVSTNYNVFEHEIESAFSHHLIFSRIDRFENLSNTCKTCDLNFVCGGGYIPHRYSKDNLFDNPSIFCTDIKFIINHIKAKLYNSNNLDLVSRITENQINVK